MADPDDAPRSFVPGFVSGPGPDYAAALLAARLGTLRERRRVDPVLAMELASFPEALFGLEGTDAVCRAGERTCTIRDREIVIGHATWPQSKRIPL